MDVKVQNDLAIQRFVEYVQIKTVQPEPDYAGAFEYLKRYAQELNLEYSSIQTDDDRYAAVLTVTNARSSNRSIDVFSSGERRRRANPFCSIRILMSFRCSKSTGRFRRSREKSAMERSTDEALKI